MRAASGESALAGAVVPLALGGTRALRYAELLRPRTGGLRASRHELTTSRLRAYWTSPSGFKAVALNVRDALVGARGSRRGVVTLPTTARAGELAASRLDAAKRGGFTRAREDVASLRRLRVTKGFSLPSDLPVHVICGSKDVIHS